MSTAQRTLTTTGRPPRRHEPAPFDQRLSTAIDVNIIRAESTTCPVKRELLRLQRRWYERRVPAFYPAGRAN